MNGIIKNVVLTTACILASASANSATVTESVAFYISASEETRYEFLGSTDHLASGQGVYGIKGFDSSLGTLDAIRITLNYEARSRAGATFIDYGSFMTISGTAEVKEFSYSVSIGGVTSSFSEPKSMET